MTTLFKVDMKDELIIMNMFANLTHGYCFYISNVTHTSNHNLRQKFKHGLQSTFNFLQYINE